MFIDVHTHAFHPKIAAKVLAQLEDHYGIPPVGTGLVEDLLARLAAAGIHRAAVHTAATDPAQVIPANNWSIGLKKAHPELIPFGTLHPGFPEPEKELDRLAAYGIRGIKFHADFQGFRLDDPKFLELLEILDDRFTLMLHVGDEPEPAKNPSCPFKVRRILKDFPRLTLIAAHLGGYLHWKWALEELAGTEAYLDTSSSLFKIDDATLQAIFDRHPRERILFGSDYPLFDPGREAELLQTRLRLSDSGMETLLGNGCRLLGCA